MFGDIIAIYNSYGARVARYAYDAYGVCKVMSSGGAVNIDKDFVGNINPFRYRSYYYDVETKLYYLQSRYYDPSVGRFINADSLEYLDPETAGGLNLYAYCNCNPVMHVDPEGTAWWNWVIGAVAAVAVAALTIVTCGAAVGIAAVATGAIVGGAYGAANAAANGDNVIEGMFTGMISGVISAGTAAIGGGFISTGSKLLGLGIAIWGGAASGAYTEVNTQLNNNGRITDIGSITHSTAVGAFTNVISTLLGPSDFDSTISAVVGSYVVNVVFGVIGFAIDSLKR